MLNFGYLNQAGVVSQAGLFGSGSGQKLTKILGLFRARDVIFVLGAQKHIKIIWQHSQIFLNFRVFFGHNLGFKLIFGLGLN